MLSPVIGLIGRLWGKPKRNRAAAAIMTAPHQAVFS